MPLEHSFLSTANFMHADLYQISAIILRIFLCFRSKQMPCKSQIAYFTSGTKSCCLQTMYLMFINEYYQNQKSEEIFKIPYSLDGNKNAINYMKM